MSTGVKKKTSNKMVANCVGKRPKNEDLSRLKNLPIAKNTVNFHKRHD